MLLSRLSPLKEYRFNHNFRNCINYNSSGEVESIAHFLLHCHQYLIIRVKLLNILELTDTNLTKPSEKATSELSTLFKTFVYSKY